MNMIIITCALCLGVQPVLSQPLSECFSSAAETEETLGLEPLYQDLLTRLLENWSKTREMGSEFDVFRTVQMLSSVETLNDYWLKEAASLWKSNNTHMELEIVWIKSKSRQIRLMVLMLFYMNFSDTDVDHFPDFYDCSSRFCERELEERLEELNFISERHRHAELIRIRIENCTQNFESSRRHEGTRMEEGGREVEWDDHESK